MGRANDGSLDLPYESHGDPDYIKDEFALSGGLVVMAATVPDGDDMHPGLVFRFAAADGSGFYTPMLLVLNDDQVEGLVELVTKAANDALKAANEARS